MPYFFILPAYFALLIALFGTAIVTRFVPRFQPASSYIVGGTVGTMVGFIFINVLVIVVGVLPVWLTKNISFPDWLQQVSKIFVAAALLIGPFIGSAIGVMLGFCAGLYFVHSRRRNAG